MSFPAVIFHRKDRLEDLPDDVFERVLRLLTFGQKAGVRLVSKHWKKAVDYMFSRQTSVRICFKPDQGITNDQGIQFMVHTSYNQHCLQIGSWQLFECEHIVDAGYVLCMSYGHFDEANKSLAVDRFVRVVRFVLKYFRCLTVVRISCGWDDKHRGFRTTRLKFSPEGEERVAVVCQEIASRVGHQLECFSCPFLDVTENHSLPELVHIECQHISENIHNVFAQVAPNLKVLHCDLMHADNFQHLPKGFISIQSLNSRETEDVIAKMLASKGRLTLRSIKLGVIQGGTSYSGDDYFPHLQRFAIGASYDEHPGYPFDPSNLPPNNGRLEKVLFRSASGLRLLSHGEHPLPPELRSQFDASNLQSLTGYSLRFEELIAIVEKLHHLRHLVTRLTILASEENLIPSLTKRLIQVLSQRRLETLDVPWMWCTNQMLIHFLTGKCRTTLKLLRIEELRVLPMGEQLTWGNLIHEVGDILQELQLMTRTESLEFGIVNQKMVSKAFDGIVFCPDYNERLKRWHVYNVFGKRIETKCPLLGMKLL